MYSGKRSKKANERRKQAYEVRRYTFQTAFHDRIIKEIVCTQTPEDIDAHLKDVILEQPQVYFASNEGWQDGLVLVSSLTFEIIQNMINLPSDPVWALRD